MKILRFFGTIIAIFFGAILGTVVGDQIRALVTQTPTKIKVNQFDEETKETTIAVQPFLSYVLPAWLAGILCKPHWLWAFLVGALAGGLLSDRYEQQLKDLIEKRG
jgi:outer membrane lipoprotein SlyB